MLEQRLRAHRGLKRVAMRPAVELRARYLRQTLGSGNPTDISIAEGEGWTKFDVSALPALSDPIARLQALAERWVGEEDRWVTQARMPLKLCRPEDLLAHAELFEVALDSRILRAVSRYLGQVPRLYHLELWWSPVSQ